MNLKPQSRSKEKILYRIYIRELNKISSTKLSTLYILDYWCYDLKPLEEDQRTTLVLSNTRELDRVPSTKQSTLYTNPHGPC